jgi:hypothetical protein
MMRGSSKVIAILVFALLPFTPLQAQETLLTVGVPGNITATNSISGNVSGETISTAQIDGVLRTVAPSAFGQNFTRDKANKAFADFANLRTRLASSLIQAVEASDSSLRINSVVINTNALNLRLAQKTNSVSGQLGTLSARVSGRKIIGVPIICPSANFSFSVNNIKATGDYNFITGDVSNTVITYDITDINSSCNGFGFLNFIANLANDAFGIGSGLIRGAVMDGINNQLAFVNMKQLFSLSDFANGLSRFRSETPLSAVGNRAIMIFQEMVNDAAINTPGIVLDFKVAFASTATDQNKISILASNAPVDVASVVRPNTTRSVIVGLSGATSDKIDIYYGLGSGNWTLAQTFVQSSAPRSSFRLPEGLPENSSVIAIASNGLISGLDSFPGAAGVAPPFRRCTADYCPPIE